MLYDTFQRPHQYLRISLTERCNLRCFYCMPEEGVEHSPLASWMTADEILTIARTFVELGVTKIRLTGGEPLLRRDAGQIIERLGALPVTLTLTTNGILIHKYIAILKKAGVKTVNVSLDTLDADKFTLVTKRPSFERVWNNIQLLLQEGFKVKLNVVLMRAINWEELLDFVALTQKQPIGIQFIEFMPFDGNQWDWSKGISLAEILTQVEQHYGREQVLRIQDQPHDTSINYQIKGHQGNFAIISTITNPFCGTCNRIRLTANGQLKNCLFSKTETDILGPLRAGEAIIPLIHSNLAAKAKSRGGMEQLEDFADPQQHGQNRSMILIGG
ncbi:MAG: GTP 3',8-cyclase MoaA [Aureispira sp.]